MDFSSRRRFTPLLLLFTLLAAGPWETRAASISWTGNATNAFGTAGNWSGANTPPLSGDSLVFGPAGTSGLLLNNNLTGSAFNVGGITFNAGAGAFVIGDGTTAAHAGNAFALTGSIANNSTSLETINNQVILSGVRTFSTAAGAGNLTLGGDLSGATGGIAVAGGGTVTLTGTNTYAGGTSIASGATFQLGAGGASGSIAGNVTDNGTFAFNRSDDFTFGGVISGPGGVTQSGNILRFGSAQTYTGPTQISAGFLVLPTTLDFGLSASTVVTVAAGATLDLSNRAQKIGGLAGAGAVYSFGGSAGSLTLDVTAGQTYTFAGSVGLANPNFSLMKSSAGTQILSGANAYTGPTTVNGGRLLSTTSSALGSTSSIAVNNAGSTLAVSFGGPSDYTPAQVTTLLAKTTFGSVTTALAFDTTNAVGPVAFGNPLTMAAGFTKLGPGTLILSGNNTYTGATVISGGTLLSPNNSALGTTGSITVNNAGSTLAISYGGPADYTQAQLTALLAKTTFSSATAALGFDTTNAGGPVTYATALSMAAAFTKLGAGTLILSANNSYAGGTIVSAGTLQVGAGGATGTIGGNVTNNGALVFNRSDDFTETGAISGTGGVTQNGNILRFSAASTYAGPTQINAGVLVLPTTVDFALAASSVATVAAGAKLDLSNHAQRIAGLAGAGSVYSFGGSAGNLALNVAVGQTYTFSGSVGLLDPNFALSMVGNGTQILSGANTYTGATTIAAGGGTLQLGDGGTTGSLNPASSITNDATLVLNRSNTLTQSTDFGTISGAGRLIQRGGGTVILNSANTYQSGTIVESGTLQIGNGGAAGSIFGGITNNGTVAFKRSDDFTFAAVITGSGGLVNNGSTLRFTYAQAYTGPTVINSGTLVLTLGGDQGISASSLLTVATGARLDFSNKALSVPGLDGGGQVYSFGGSAGAFDLNVAAGDTHTFSGTLGGPDPNFAFSKSNLGTQILSGANTYTGPTTVRSGTLRLAFGTVSSNILPSTSSLALGGSNLVLTGTGTQTVNGLTISAGAANSILLGANETLTLGTLTAGAGASLLFDTSAGGANAGTANPGTAVVVLTGQTQGAVIRPGFTVSDAAGFGYATVDAANRVVRLTTATALLPAGGADATTAYTVNNNAGGPAAPGSSTLTLTAAASAGGILVDSTAGSGLLTLAGGVVFRTNVWNFNGTGANPYTITGGAGLSAITAGDQVAINNYNAGTITFDSAILPNGVTALVVNGTGTTVLTRANTYNGGTTVNGGTLQITAGALAAPLQGLSGAGGNPAGVGPGGPGGHAMVVNRNASLVDTVNLVGGTGGNGASGLTDQTQNTGFPGGAGGAGGIGLIANTSGSVSAANLTGGAGGAGGQGASNIDYVFFRSQAPAGGAGGAGGTGVLVSNAGLLSLTAGSITGGSGGAGGPGGVGFEYSTTGFGGAGGAGGTGLVLKTGIALNITTVTGGAAGIGGYAGVNASGSADGIGPTSVSGAGGLGGAGISVDNGITVALPATAVVTGGLGGAGSNGTASTYISGNAGNAGSGGAGGAGVLVSAGGSLANSGTLTGGHGSAGGAGAPNVSLAGNGGDGGDGGAGVRLAVGGSLTNSGTITGGRGASGGAAGLSQTFGRNGLPGQAGRNGSGVLFTGAPGTLSNLTGGFIDGGVAMDNFANAVTLQPGSEINGALSIGTNTASTLTLSGSGSQAYSGAVTGTTVFAGSLIKSGTGSWLLDQPLTYLGTTTVSAGILRVGASLGNTAASVAAGAALGGEGSLGGTLNFSSGSVLRADGSTPGALSVAGNVTLNGTVQVTLDGGPAALGIGQTIRVLNYSGTLTGSAVNLAGAELRNAVFSTATAHQIDVTFDTKALTWSGGTASWDINTTANWNAGAERFFAGDAVTFDDTGTNKAVTIGGVLATNSVSITNSAANPYSFSGPGSIGSIGALTKSGAGLATLNVPASFGGAMSINGGTLSLSSALTAGGAITVSASGSLSELAGASIAGAASLSVSGNSVLLGTNTYTGATTITGATLQVGNGGTGGSLSPASALTDNGALVFNRSNTITQGVDFAGPIDGSGSLTQQGGGTLILTSANTYSGGTTITGGTLQLGTGAASGSLVGNVTNNGMLIFNRNDNFTFAGTISGSGGVAYGASVFRLSLVETYTGATQVNAGVLVLTTAADFGLASAGAVTIATGASLDMSGRNQRFAGLDGGGGVSSFNSTASTLTLDVASGQTHAFSGTVGGGSPNFGLTKSGSGTQILSGANSYLGATIISGGTLSLAGTLSGGGPVSTTGSGVLAQSSTGSIAGGSSFTVGGTGTSILAGANSYAGGTTIANGATLQLGNGGASGSIFGSVTNNGTLSFQRSDDFLFNGVISGSGTVVQSGSILRFSNPQTYTGPTQVNTGFLVLPSSADFGLAAATAVGVGNPAILDLSGRSQRFAGLDGGGTVYSFNSNASTLTLDLPSGQMHSFAGNLGGAFANFALSKGGAGTQVLAGTNSYTGATNVSAGTLEVDGSITGSSGVSVSVGGTLSGHGRVSALNGAGLADPSGILTGTQVDLSGGLDFTFNLTQSGAPAYNNAAASGNDVLHLTDATPFVMALTAANVITVDFSGLTPVQGQTYLGGFFLDANVPDTMLNSATFVYTGLAGTAQYDGLVTVPSAAFGTGTVANGRVMEFKITAVPEPGSASLALLGTLALLRRRRRRDSSSYSCSYS